MFFVVIRRRAFQIGVKRAMKTKYETEVWNNSMKPMYETNGMKTLWNQNMKPVWNQNYETNMKPVWKQSHVSYPLKQFVPIYMYGYDFF